MLNFNKFIENWRFFIHNEYALFKKSKYPISFKPLLVVQGLAVLLLFVAIASFFIPAPKTNQALVIKTATTKQLTAIIANGQPVKWSVIVKRSEITNTRSLLKLPKTAKNIKAQTISKAQATIILAKATPKPQLAMADRQKLAAAGKPKNFLAKISSFLFADLEQAVGDAVQQLADQVTGDYTPITQTPDAIIVDLSSQAGNDESKQEKQEEKQEKQESKEQKSAPTPEVEEVGTVLGLSPPEAEQTQTEEQPEETPPEIGSQQTLPAESPELEGISETPQTPATETETPAETPAIDTVSPSDQQVVENPNDSPSPEAPASTAKRGESAEQSQTPTTNDQPNTDEDTNLNDQIETTPDIATNEPVEEVQDEYVQVDYETPAPTITEQETEKGKLVTVSDSNIELSQPQLTNVLAFTNIPEIFKVGQESKIKIKWKNPDCGAIEDPRQAEACRDNGGEMPFTAYDLNNNGKLDYVEWTVPHLSAQVFEIIFISKAWWLDQNQEIIEDIYDTVATQDQNYATVPQNDYVRVTFQAILHNTNDITIYAKPTGLGDLPAVEVYPVYTDANGNQTQWPKLETAADGQNPDFSNIDHDGKYRVLLTNLEQPTDVFDLKVVCIDVGCLSNSLDIDYIVDPTPSGAPADELTEPANSSSVGNLQTIIGTPNATTQSTSTLFNYLRKLEQDRLNTAAGAVAENTTDEGKLEDLLGASAAAQDRVTIFDYIHKLYNDLVNLVAGNIKLGATIGGLTGSYSGYPGTGWSGTTITQSACDAQNASGWYWFADGNGDGDTTDAEDGVCVKSTTVTSTSWNGSEQMGTTAITAQAATGGSSNTIVKASAGWTADAYVNMVADITAGTAAGCWGIVKTNTSDTITVWGSWLSSAYASNCGTPDATSVFSVEDDGFTLYDNSWIGDWTCDGTAFPNGAPSWGSFPTSAKVGSAVIALATADCYDGTRDLLATEASRAVKTGTATAADATTITDTALSLNTNEYIGQKVLITGGTGANGYGRIESNTGTVITVDSWTGGSPGVGSAFSIIYVIPHATYNPNTDVDGNDDTELRGNNGPLTQEVLNNWKGTRLPTASDFFGFCGYNSTDGSGDGSYENTTGTYTADKTYGNYGGQVGRTDEFLDLGNSGSWEWLSEQHIYYSARLAGLSACSYFDAAYVLYGYRFRAVFRP